jgi:hypothetical protein
MEGVVNAPVIIDVGKASRKKVRRIKKGGGGLMNDIQDAMAEVKASIGSSAEGQQLVPVVLLYKKKRRKKSKRCGFPKLF